MHKVKVLNYQSDKNYLKFSVQAYRSNTTQKYVILLKYKGVLLLTNVLPKCLFTLAVFHSCTKTLFVLMLSLSKSTNIVRTCRVIENYQCNVILKVRKLHVVTTTLSVTGETIYYKSILNMGLGPPYCATLEFEKVYPPAIFNASECALKVYQFI